MVYLCLHLSIHYMFVPCTQDPISDQLLIDEKRLLKLLNNTEISSTVSEKRHKCLFINVSFSFPLHMI